MYRFQEGLYKTWKSFFVALGLFWPAYLFGAILRGRSLNDYPFWGNMLVIFVPFTVPFIRYFLYQSIQNTNFIFNYILYKKKIPIQNILSLSYEQRPAWRYLVLAYTDEKGNETEKEWSVDFHDPIDILRLNEELQKINPSIKISFDDKFQQFMEKQKDIHKKAPTSVIGWIWFAMRWGGITALLNYGLLEFIHLVNPSAFKK